ncbi:protein NRT1/ PTR FAMILY 7.3-like isoform X1 [Cicer arietinum]|uniref:Protein NRT1/ PTR FAMILY 7.3-like isoform X1 n=2 Tax=Cicer arietinum TaxID=3827 RepID=A0A1S2YLC9_CICAR|nr:protein NRT1/ PTR FAMILY 7.3-like isoform X1 [Cicer arietinum]XP_027191656.1 protein NRT1/ PTR FAMILY 7.3-like isoform X1 [Cicer arietinum]XP_027191657.1 protein NRT1/ PTR FAMILY 7.3-like isoform X1 [Cicer arietinum]
MARKVFELDGHEEGSISPCTKDGSIDCYGKPAIKARTGGWRSASLLLVNQLLVALAFTGVEVNLVLFAKLVLRQSNAESANTFSRWMGTTYCFSLIGAFLSDSYLGRYLTCIIFQVVFNIGLVLLSLSTHFLLLKPQGCGKIGFLCEPHTPFQVAILYISIYLIALGNGAADPALATFGADQFDEEEPKEEKSKTLFYSYFYVALNLGSLVAETVLAYIETSGNWILGFWICSGCGCFSFLVFMTGTLRYRHMKTSQNPISRFAQVIVSSVKKIKFQMPANGEGLYEIQEGDDSSGRRMLHTNGLRFLDRAAIISINEKNKLQDKSQIPNPWQLCTVTQVEEVKCILRLLPVWFCTIFSSVVFIQMLSLFVEQGSTMNRKFYKFQIPPASMTAFDIISTSAFIMLFDVLIVPIYVKVMKRSPKLPSELKRIGIGLAFTIIALVVAGLVERKRLEFASKDGKETSSLSIFWQIPQYVLVGVAEAFVYVAQMNFFTSQAPDGLKSLGMGLSMSSSALGSYVANTILIVVMKITTRNGQPGWVSPNLNEGHLDRFFFLSASLTAINLVFYVVCARRYKVIEFEKREEGNNEEVVI